MPKIGENFNPKIKGLSELKDESWRDKSELCPFSVFILEEQKNFWRWVFLELKLQTMTAIINKEMFAPVNFFPVTNYYI